MLHRAAVPVLAAVVLAGVAQAQIILREEPKPLLRSVEELRRDLKTVLAQDDKAEVAAAVLRLQRQAKLPREIVAALLQDPRPSVRYAGYRVLARRKALPPIVDLLRGLLRTVPAEEHREVERTLLWADPDDLDLRRRWIRSPDKSHCLEAARVTVVYPRAAIAPDLIARVDDLGLFPLLDALARLGEAAAPAAAQVVDGSMKLVEHKRVRVHADGRAETVRKRMRDRFTPVLAAIGAPAIPAILVRLPGARTDQVLRLVKALHHIEATTPESRAALLRLAQGRRPGDPEEDRDAVARAALHAMTERVADYPEAAVVPDFARLLSSWPEEKDRAGIFRAVRLAVPGGALLRAFDGGTVDERVVALRALARDSGPDGIPAAAMTGVMQTAARSDDARLRVAAVRGIRVLPGAERWGLLAPLLDDASEEVLVAALGYLELFRVAPDELLPKVLKLVDAPATEVRRSARRVLAPLGPAAAAALPRLEQQLQGGVPGEAGEVFATILPLLPEVEARAARVCAVLTGAPALREAALAALQLRGPLLDRVLARLDAGGCRQVLEWAVRLGLKDRELAPATVGSLLASADTEVRRLASELLVGSVEVAVPQDLLEKNLAATDVGLRAATLRLLSTRPESARVMEGRIAARLLDPEGRIRSAAAEVVLALDAPALAPQIVMALDRQGVLAQRKMVQAMHTWVTERKTDLRFARPILERKRAACHPMVRKGLDRLVEAIGR